MFDDTRPSAVVFGDSNTWAFGPAWVQTLVRQGWPSHQVVLHHRSGSTPRHWLPKGHPLHHAGFGVLSDREDGGQPSVHDALSPATQLVIIGLGGNMVPGTSDDASADALVALVTRLAPAARIVWRGPPPSTASHTGRVATRATRASRYRCNGMLKQRLCALGFEVLGERATPTQQRLYLDVLALHATGPARGVQPLGTGRDVDLEQEQTLVAALQGDRWARGEVALRGPWASFVRARDTLPSHVPRDTAADLVEIVAGRSVLLTPRRAPDLPLVATVVDPDARIRQGAPSFRWIRDQRIPQGNRVLVRTWKGRYAEVLDATSRESLGWTWRGNLELEPLCR